MSKAVKKSNYAYVQKCLTISYIDSTIIEHSEYSSTGGLFLRPVHIESMFLCLLLAQIIEQIEFHFIKSVNPQH